MLSLMALKNAANQDMTSDMRQVKKVIKNNKTIITKTGLGYLIQAMHYYIS